MRIKRVLILCKRSAYQFYFIDGAAAQKAKRVRFSRAVRAKFKKSHDEHYATITLVESVLSASKITFIKKFRGQKIDYRLFDCVVTIGGDGTFLEAARHVTGQLMVGVNSDPKRSIGRLCGATRKNFERLFSKIIQGNSPIKKLIRLKLKTSRYPHSVNVLNDILVCHKNPAAMSRYEIVVNGVREEQRSSGLWISTPTGSSGAIHSAGGKIMPRQVEKLQYLPRELFRGRGIRYSLAGGMVSVKRAIKVNSLMRNGVVYVDGSHFKIPFSFGDKVHVSISKTPLTVAVEHP